MKDALTTPEEKKEFALGMGQRALIKPAVMRDALILLSKEESALGMVQMFAKNVAKQDALTKQLG